MWTWLLCFSQRIFEVYVQRKFLDVCRQLIMLTFQSQFTPLLLLLLLLLLLPPPIILLLPLLPMVLPAHFLILPSVFFLQSLLLSCRFAPVWTPLHILKQPQQNGRLLWPYGSRHVLPSINSTLWLCVGITFHAGINSVVSE